MAAKTKKASKTDLSSLSEQDILRNIEEAETRLKRMKFSHAITPIDNPMSIRIMRRELDQLKTEKRRKQLES